MPNLAHPSPAPPDAPIAGILLAAGTASRMGHQKQLLDWDGQPLIRAIAQHALAATLNPLIVVLGSAATDIAHALDGLPLQHIINPAYAQGQSTSLRAGIAALPPTTAAALILLSDQPFVTTAIIKRIIAEWQNTGAAIIAPTYAGQRGNPVLFARSLFPELMALVGDQGARGILAADPSRITNVTFADPHPLADIDTRADYERLRAHLPQRTD